MPSAVLPAARRCFPSPWPDCQPAFFTSPDNRLRLSRGESLAISLRKSRCGIAHGLRAEVEVEVADFGICPEGMLPSAALEESDRREMW
jgi:hypothetical protein